MRIYLSMLRPTAILLAHFCDHRSQRYVPLPPLYPLFFYLGHFGRDSYIFVSGFVKIRCPGNGPGALFHPVEGIA